MEIYTNAPRALDYRGSQEIGHLDVLRIVTVGGPQKVAEVQLLRYVDRGFFATSCRSDALTYVAQHESRKRPSSATDVS